jgi:hypothetical protein
MGFFFDQVSTQQETRKPLSLAPTMFPHILGIFCYCLEAQTVFTLIQMAMKKCEAVQLGVI